MNRQKLDIKIREAFGDLIIDKALVRNLKIRDKRTIPSFVEEWLISRFQKAGKSNADIYQDVTAFMSKHLPAKTEKERIKYELQSGEALTILDRFNIRVDIAKDKNILSIPCIEEINARVSDNVIEQNPILLEGGQWGAGRLIVRSEDKINVIEMVDFKPMQSGKVDLNALVEAREHFSTQEWIYLLLRTMGYEPSAYTKAQQANLILRLLPLVQNNLNMMELAPKGTGKSFIFSNLSRYVWVN
ncbi:MAG: BREX system Lon protease-like protein BrxL, partial [Methylococcaceae bacterium]